MQPEQTHVMFFFLETQANKWFLLTLLHSWHCHGPHQTETQKFRLGSCKHMDFQDTGKLVLLNANAYTNGFILVG